MGIDTRRRRQRFLEEWDRPDPSRVRIVQRDRAFQTPQRVNLNDPLHPPLVPPVGVCDWYHGINSYI